MVIWPLPARSRTVASISLSPSWLHPAEPETSSTYPEGESTRCVWSGTSDLSVE